MNPETGKIVPVRKTKPAPKGWVKFALGDKVEIWGVLCSLEYVNHSKRRLTFVPVAKHAPFPNTTTDPSRPAQPER